MKMLIIGMDGVSRGTFDRGWTPFISEVLEAGHDLNLSTDLYSRGWLELATGEHAIRTGAAYDKPVFAQPYALSESFKFDEIEGFTQKVIPIWSAVEKLGFKFGLMNLPTTFPAPELNGFCVAGGGGGGPVTESPTLEHCWPRSLHSILIEEGYIVDQRLQQLILEHECESVDAVLKKMAEKNRLRTKSFIRCASERGIDVGWVVYKTSSVLVENFVQQDLYRASAGEICNENVLKAAEQYYAEFDEQIRQLKQAFPDASLLFVSDHGMVRRTHTVNPNILLKKCGWYVESPRKRLSARVIAAAKKLVPFKFKMLLKGRQRLKELLGASVAFSPAATQAFCKTKGDWRYGIYINDARFRGPVKQDEYDRVVDGIIADINGSDLAKAHEITAYRAEKISHCVTEKPAWFPDILLKLPDGYLISDQGTEFIAEYDFSENLEPLQAILQGQIISIKSTSPIATFVPSTSDLSTPRPSATGRGYLTDCYDFILKYLEVLKTNE